MNQFWFAIPCLLLLAGSLGSQSSSAGGRLVIENVRVFDGVKVLPSVTVVIEDGKVAFVGSSPKKVRGEERINGLGYTLLPGLIDAHVHLAGDRKALKESAKFGVTTVFEMWTAPERMRGLRRLVDSEPATDEADFLSSGAGATVRGGHGHFSDAYPTIANVNEADEFVRARIAEGSQYIKIIVERGSPMRPLPTLDSPVIYAVTRAAHSQGRKAIAHATRFEDVRLVADAGVDGLAHAWVGGIDDGLLRLLSTRRIFVIPTLAAVESRIDTSGSESILRDPYLAPLLSEDSRKTLQASRGGFLKVDRQEFYKLVQRLKGAKVTILAGTDAGNPGIAHGASLHRELELLVLAGLSTQEALAAATSVPAIVFGLSDRGRIRVGDRADLILVKGDPIQDIGATRAIVAVWRQGRRIAVSQTKPN
jgi:imidazolonepropionase-like amidohydrolase